MEIAILSYFNNPHIGLYCVATDRFCLLPSAAPDKLLRKVKEVLRVPVFRSNIAGTELIGALCIAKGNKLLIPKIAFDNEIAKLKSFGLDVSVLDTEQTALGNNIVVGKDIALAGHNYTDDEITELSKAFGLKVEKRSIMRLNTLGSLILVTKQGGLVHPWITEKEKLALEEYFGVKLIRTTVNQGLPYVSIGVVANSSGILVGEQTKGIELLNIQNALLKED